MQTTVRVVFPAAISGIAAAVVLGISRGLGETMIVATAAGQRPNMVTSPFEGGQTMTGFIANAALGDSRVGSLEYDTLFAVGLLLFLFTLVVNIDQHPDGPPVPGGLLMPAPTEKYSPEVKLAGRQASNSDTQHASP